MIKTFFTGVVWTAGLVVGLAVGQKLVDACFKAD